MAYFTALVIFNPLKMIAAIGSYCKLFACMRVFRAFDLVVMEIRGWMLIGWIGVTAGILTSNAEGGGRVDGRVLPLIMGGLLCS